MADMRRSMTPIESPGIQETDNRRPSGDWSLNEAIPHSESTARLLNNVTDQTEAQDLTKENLDKNNRRIGTKNKQKVLMGHSSRTSMEVLNNNTQDPIDMDDDITPDVTIPRKEPNMSGPDIPRRPPVSPHYIGYHPTKLYKVKEKLHNSEGLAFLPGDKLVVADKHDGHLTVFDSEGHFERILVKGIKPCGVATNRSGMIAFTDVKHKKEKVVKVYTEDGSKISEFGKDFTWKPRGITVSNKGLLVVTDIESKRHCIGTYTTDGKMMAKFGNKGDGREELAEPLYVHVDIKDRILVSDKSHHCVKVYDEKGNYLGKIGHHGSGDGALLNPRGITEDAYGHILICDTGNRRVSAFSHEGHFIKHLLQASDGVQYPVDIAFSKRSGRLAVTMHKPNGEFHKLRVYQLPSIENMTMINSH